MGTAVVRNRIRRRLRAMLRQLVLAPGDYLFGVAPVARDLEFSQLSGMIATLVGRCREETARCSG